MLTPPLAGWGRFLWSERPAGLPDTPLDHTHPAYAAGFRFLAATRPHLPPEATVTVVARRRELEMPLTMMAGGLLPRARIQPSSYYGVETPEVGRRARYVLAFRCRGLRAERPPLAARVEEGCLYLRAGPASVAPGP